MFILKVREVDPQDTLYKFKYNWDTDNYDLDKAVKVSKVTSKYIYLDDDSDTKLLRKGKFPLVDNVGRDPWISAYLGEVPDKYSPDKYWNIMANKQLKDKQRLDNDLEATLDNIKEHFKNSSVENKKTVLEKLKDIN